MSMNLDQLIRENMDPNEPISTIDEVILNVLGELTVSDLVSSFIGKQDT